MLEVSQSMSGFPHRDVFDLQYLNVVHFRSACIDVTQAQQMSLQWTLEMDCALVSYHNNLCRHLAVAPSRLHPHEVYLTEAELASAEYSCLQGEQSRGLVKVRVWGRGLVKVRVWGRGLVTVRVWGRGLVKVRVWGRGLVKAEGEGSGEGRVWGRGLVKAESGAGVW